MSPLSDIFCACSSVSRAGASSSISKPQGPEPTASVRSTGTLGAERGAPVQACVYEADPEDPIDTQFSLQLLSLDRVFASQLLVQRLCEGQYELDGRRVRLRWGDGTQGGSRTGLLVCEEAAGSLTNEVPLASYLRQAQDVAASLGGRSVGSPAVARVPADRRLTFTVAEAQAMSDPCPDRIRSMRVACEQARLREEAAEAYERGETARAAALHTPLGSGVLSLPPPPGPPLLPCSSGALGGPPPSPVQRRPPSLQAWHSTGSGRAPHPAAVRSASSPPPGVLLPMVRSPSPGGFPRLQSQRGTSPSPPPRTWLRSMTPTPPPSRQGSRVLPAAAAAPMPGRSASKNAAMTGVFASVSPVPTGAW